MTKRSPWRVTALLAALLTLAGATQARAAEEVYFSATDNLMNVLLQRINAETLRIDIGMWLLTERTISSAIINRHKAGVQVRLIGDRGSIFEIDPFTRREFYWLASQGLPIRIRVNPTWYPEIMHWKAAIFAAQRVVMFGSANYTPFELAPASSSNYKDEIVLLSDDQILVNAFRTKFDRMWNDTTSEPESKIGAPPFLKDWDDACRAESACNDYWTTYPTPVPMLIDTRRLEPDNMLPAEMNWGQGGTLNNRLVQTINGESGFVDIVAYRMTVPNIADALIQKHRAGVPVRVIIEPNEYLNRKWPEFWLTHAYVDKMWAAGVPIKVRAHDGLTHMKLMVTSSLAMIGSSNFSESWQRDHNYFMPASKSTIHTAIRNRFNAMWNNSSAFAPFAPGGPDTPVLDTPGNGASDLGSSVTLTWNRAAFAVRYDVYLGTSLSAMARVANVPAHLGIFPPETYSWTASGLQAGATYFWRIVSRTFATDRNSAITGSTGVWSFTTSGTSGGGGGESLPTPWTNRDIGSVGPAGSAGFANGTFTVSGSGADIWGSSDAFHYVSQPVSGDVDMTVRVASMQNTHFYAKTGVMLRESLTAGSAHVLINHIPSGIEMIVRRQNGGSTSFIAGNGNAPPTWLRLSRRGGTVTGYVSETGTSWTTLGSTSFSSASAHIGMAVSSHNTSQLNTSLFTNVSVTSGGTAPPSSASNIVIYASDIPTTSLHGAWSRASDSTSPNGIKLVTSNAGFAQTNNPLASPAHYVDVTFNATAGVAYRIWLRLQALNNDKFNDAVWVQFSDARVNGSAAYPINSTSGLLVNLATDSGAGSLNRWGWQNGAYWLSQPTAVTFPTTGSRTMRIQVREDGVQLDQIVLSPGTYLNSAPGPVSNDSTVVPK